MEIIKRTGIFITIEGLDGSGKSKIGRAHV